ncbi:MAG: ANTAR domain-containing protein [Actinomycetota bacterium]|nr:ANTAR domain-containing protein [Actinomycetota bacterium]
MHILPVPRTRLGIKRDERDGGRIDPANRQVGDHVHQATGMVAAQLDCDVTEALARLRIRADATGQTLKNIALDVLDGVTVFYK